MLSVLLVCLERLIEVTRLGPYLASIGVMRCAAYTTVTNNALYAPVGDSRQPQSAIQHFHDKLIHIRDRLKTEYGQRLGAKRHQVLLDFIAAVEEEYAGPVSPTVS